MSTRCYTNVSMFGADRWQRKNYHAVTKEKAPQPCGAATPEEADARCKRAHPLPPACCIIPQDLGTKVPLVYPCEPLCGLLRGRVASPAPEEDFEPLSGEFEQASSALKKKQEKGIGAFRANAYSQQPAVRAAARVCGFWKLTFFSRLPELFDAKFEKSRRKAPRHKGLRRRFDIKSVCFMPL